MGIHPIIVPNRGPSRNKEYENRLEIDQRIIMDDPKCD